MARLTTFRVGGPAEALYEASDPLALAQVLRFLRAEGIPYLPVGRGSNLLVGDGGLPGVAILLKKELASLYGPVVSGGGLLWAGAGLPLSRLLVACGRKGWGGLEFLAGIPGSLGGAVVMNAGTGEESIGSQVRCVELVTPEGEVLRRERQALHFGYRSFELSLPHGKASWGWSASPGALVVITRVALGLRPEAPSRVKARLASNLKRRKATQPLSYPSAGCVFKNPPGDFAGRLLEAAGLKGVAEGGALISPKHANFIVNTGNATAAQIMRLISLARDKVKQELGVELETEIRIAGRF